MFFKVNNVFPPIWAQKVAVSIQAENPPRCLLLCPLSSCTESLTPQLVEGQDGTLFSICTCSWTQQINLSLEGSLEHTSVMLLCLLFIDSVLTALMNLSNCEKQMAMCVPWELALFGLGA